MRSLTTGTNVENYKNGTAISDDISNNPAATTPLREIIETVPRIKETRSDITRKIQELHTR